MISARTLGGLWRLTFLWLVWCGAGSAAMRQPGTAAVPDAVEIARLLEQSPISAETWPVWRERFLQWYEDRSGAADDFEKQLANYLGQQFNATEKTLPAPLADDPIAWHLLGNFYMQAKDPANPNETLQAAEAAFRRSLEIDPNFGGTHSRLAYALRWQAPRRRCT